MLERKKVFCREKSPVLMVLEQKKRTMPSKRTRVPMYVPSLSVVIDNKR